MKKNLLLAATTLSLALTALGAQADLIGTKKDLCLAIERQTLKDYQDRVKEAEDIYAGSDLATLVTIGKTFDKSLTADQRLLIEATRAHLYDTVKLYETIDHDRVAPYKETLRVISGKQNNRADYHGRLKFWSIKAAIPLASQTVVVSACISSDWRYDGTCISVDLLADTDYAAAFEAAARERAGFPKDDIAEYVWKNIPEDCREVLFPKPRPGEFDEDTGSKKVAPAAPTSQAAQDCPACAEHEVKKRIAD